MNLPQKQPKQINKESIVSAPIFPRVRFQANSENFDANFSIEQLSPIALAYLGDVVYELYVRTQYLLPPKKIANYHNQVVEKVRAETQANDLQILQPYLTSSEKEILRRGRNAAAGKPRRLSLQIYQQATSLETLIGYLYLTDPHRLSDLLEKLDF
ncbi:MAG: ribonuclease III domain-containing protein [Xenococcaceae cyanobacterium MO_188.B29]|nr:ribonuclease III domain-containing protein [Xenococcaceae cyanobacterium MO_188.B29]